MAHQAHNIPWTTFAYHFRCKFGDPDLGEESFLYASGTDVDAKDFNYFVEAFLRNLKDHSTTERKKLPQYAPPDPEDELIDDKVAERIAASVFKMRQYHTESYNSWHTTRLENPSKHVRGPCPHREAEPACQCVVPFTERKAAAFARPNPNSPCYRFFETKDEAFFNMQLVKILILYGEMEPVLRACKIPGVAHNSWYREGHCYDTASNTSRSAHQDQKLTPLQEYTIGWDQIVLLALQAYIRLNLLLCLPKTWDSNSGKTELTDYRRLFQYQEMVHDTTCHGGLSDVEKYPHRLFFGIHPEQFQKTVSRNKSMKRKKYELALNNGEKIKTIPYGKLSYAEFLDFECPEDEEREHMPSETDVSWVRDMLLSRGLPMELALEVLESAEYHPRRRLLVDHDPLHPENREQLVKYLTFCWQLLVRCDMFATELGHDYTSIWRDELMRAIYGLAYDRVPVGGGVIIEDCQWVKFGRRPRPGPYRGHPLPS